MSDPIRSPDYLDDDNQSSIIARKNNVTFRVTGRNVDPSTTNENGNNNNRLVVVRYYLDRPGYGLHNSVARFWFNPPATCKAADIVVFLKEQKVILEDMLVEVYMDPYGSFMLLEACDEAGVEWDYQKTSRGSPGFLILRFTDLSYARQEDEKAMKSSTTGKSHAAAAVQPSPGPQHANTIAVGLLSFSIMSGLEAGSLLMELLPDVFPKSYVLAWGPSMMFIGGLLQICTALFQVVRNNIYGTVAFFGFGSYWFTNGFKLILATYASDGGQVEELLSQPDPWGRFITLIYPFLFTLVLLKQTFVMSKLSTALMSLLALKIFAQFFTPWSHRMIWVQFVFGTLTSMVAFYLFTVDFTNQVYHREVFKTFKWSEEHSPEEIFGTPGKAYTLFSKAALLRQGHHMITNHNLLAQSVSLGSSLRNISSGALSETEKTK